MDECLLSLGLIKKNVPKDSVCLFRAVAEQVYFSQSYYKRVREKVTIFIENNEGKFKSLISNMDVEKYVKTLKETASWGTQIDMIAISLIYSKDILVYIPSEKMPIKMTNNCFDEYISICTTNWNHYDCVYPQSYFKSSAFVQSLLYDVLYKGVFGIYFEYDKQFEAQLDGVNNDLINYSDKVKISSNESTSNGLEEQYEKYTGSSSPEYNKNQRKYKSDTYSYKASRRENMLKKLAKNIPVSLKILKSLDIFIFRNVAHDAWFEAKKDEQKINLSAVVNYQYAPGDICLVKLTPNDFAKNDQNLDHFYNAHIQYIKGGNKEVVVFVEDLGQKFEVKVEQLYPFPGHMGILSPNNFYGKFGGKIQSNFFNEVTFNAAKPNHKKLNKKSRFKHDGANFEISTKCINSQDMSNCVNEYKPHLSPSYDHLNFTNNFCNKLDNKQYSVNNYDKNFQFQPSLNIQEDKELSKRKEEYTLKNNTHYLEERVIQKSEENEKIYIDSYDNFYDERAKGVINTSSKTYHHKSFNMTQQCNNTKYDLRLNTTESALFQDCMTNGVSLGLNLNQLNAKKEELSNGYQSIKIQKEMLTSTNDHPEFPYNTPHFPPPPSMYYSPHVTPNYTFQNSKPLIFNNILPSLPIYHNHHHPHTINQPTQTNVVTDPAINYNIEGTGLMDGMKYDKIIHQNVVAKQEHAVLPSGGNVININGMYPHLPLDVYPSMLPPPPPGTTWVPLIFVTNNSPENVMYEGSSPSKNITKPMVVNPKDLANEKLQYDLKSPNLSIPILNETTRYQAYSNINEVKNQLNNMSLNNETPNHNKKPTASFNITTMLTLNPIDVCDSTAFTNGHIYCNSNIKSNYIDCDQENYKISKNQTELHNIINTSHYKIKKKKNTSYRENLINNKDDMAIDGWKRIENSK